MRKFLFVLSAGLVLFSPLIIQAIDIVPQPTGCQDLECLFLSFIDFIFWVAIVIAPIMFIIAGFFFVTALGDLEKIQRARNIILWTAIGLTIVVMAKGIVAIFEEIFEL